MNSEMQITVPEGDDLTAEDVSSGAAASSNTEPVAHGTSVSDGLVIYRARHVDEIPNVRDIVCEFHAEGRFSHLPFSEEKFIRFYTKALSNPHNTFLIYIQYKSKTIGVLHACVGDYYLGIGGRMVTVYGIYVSAKVRGTYLGGKVGVKLLRLVSEWAKSQDAEEIHIHSTSGIEPERTNKMLTRMGFEAYGGNYGARLI
ncbi:hypothetical protein [Pararhizobium sp. IMCC21322]|uniref:hypothetical protein n=1 Tax=Pararhizobium sp. IMCC21322 TaxID=3067903 RepID=UPI00274162B7|nr:hypothetical protein [Pararhizobium sp. IMCC21322]